MPSDASARIRLATAMSTASGSRERADFRVVEHRDRVAPPPSGGEAIVGERREPTADDDAIARVERAEAGRVVAAGPDHHNAIRRPPTRSNASARYRSWSGSDTNVPVSSAASPRVTSARKP